MGIIVLPMHRAMTIIVVISHGFVNVNIWGISSIKFIKNGNHEHLIGEAGYSYLLKIANLAHFTGENELKNSCLIDHVFFWKLLMIGTKEY